MQSSSNRYVRVSRGDPQLSRQLVQEMESDVVPVFRSRTQVATRDTEDVFRSGETRGGVRTVHTTRVVRHVTTSSTGENKTVTETVVTSSSGDEPVSLPEPRPDVRTVTKTTTKVIKQAGGSAKAERSSPRRTPADVKVTEKTRRVVKKTIIDEPIKKIKISDIITGQTDETLSARDALLRWAQYTTDRYPGVKVTDFTNSWKDGLAFNAILHRNRPDLLDFRSLRSRSARDNLDYAFLLAEKEFGITRLLDPEDVDTPEPDEKSLITYISSVYDVFPDPPSYHPFADDEKHRKIEEYKDLASSLHMWMKVSLEMLKTRNFPNTLIDMKALLTECSRFRSEDVPKRLRDKQRLSHLHRELQKLFREIGRIDFDEELHFDIIEKNWNRVMTAQQERDQSIRDEIARLEKLQRLAEKVNREAKQCDGKLDDIEKRIKEEEKRIQRLYPMDAQHNCDQIESDFRHVDDSLKSMNKDLTTLIEKHYHQAPEIQRRIQVLQERCIRIRTVFQTCLVVPLSTRSVKTEEKKVIKQRTIITEQKHLESNKSFMLVKECLEWVQNKQKRLDQAEFGNDLPSVKSRLEQHKSEYKSIEQYKRKIDQCATQKISLKGDDSVTFSDMFNKLEKSYSELLSTSAKRLQDLETLVDFVQSATKELKWMNDKEEVEVSRDWSAKNLNLVELEHHQETLTSDLEKREINFNAVQSRGESLLLQKHPASKCVEAYLTAMQSQWSWLLQLTLCLEIHLKHAQAYHQFFKEARECEQWIKRIEERLNTTFSKTVFSIDEGERFLKEMSQLREDLTRYSDIVSSVIQRSLEIVPLKQRRQPLPRPLRITAVCNYKQLNMVITKDEQCWLHDNSQRVRWKVINSSGTEGMVPGVCFEIPAPNTEAIELGENLKKKYDAILNLWTTKQRKLRQNLIFATIKVVKSWDITQFRSMETNQRESIIRALNEDTQKLLSEGPDDDPTLKKLSDEMEYCNQLFQELVQKLMSDETDKSPKSPGRKFSDTIAGLQNLLSEKEKVLKTKVQASMPRDVDTLESLVIEHKEFETELRSIESQVKEVKHSFKSVTRKTAAIQTRYDTVMQTWDRLWGLSNLYIERLKAVEIALHGLDEATRVTSNTEVRLASFDNMPSDMEALHKLHDTLLSLQTDMQQQQHTVDSLTEYARNVRGLTQRSRPKQTVHSDVNKLENDVKKLTTRWENARSQIIERLRSCGASSELLRTYKNEIGKDNVWISETTVKVNSLRTVKRITSKEVEMQVEPAMNLYTNVAEKKSSIEQTNVFGARYIREAKTVIEENYRVCGENTSKLFTWMEDIELRLADLGLVREDLSALQHQINTAKALKDELESQQHLVTSCLDQVRQLVQQGLEVLSKEEIHQLQKNLQSIKKRYDAILNECDRLLRRLVAALDELQKFRTELETFKEWLNHTQQEFNEKERSLGNLKKLEENLETYKLFASDVIAHQADLRFITMAAQKFVDESKEYLKALNVFRVNLPQRLPHMEPAESEVKAEVQEVTAIYHNLLNHVNRLSDRFSNISSKHRYYIECFDKAKIWLSEVKKVSKKILDEPVAAEPKAIQEQLDHIKTLNMEVVGQGRLIEHARQAAKTLLDTLEGVHVTPADRQTIEDTVNSLQKDYTQLANSIAEKINELQMALIHSQDIQDGLDRLLKWLDETDIALRNQSRPVSLILEKLDGQVQEFKILQSDINNQRPSIETINSSAQDLLNSSNPKLAKKVETKLKDINSRFDKLCEKASKREELLEEVSTCVRMFETMVVQFEEWTTTTVERIEGHDAVQHVDVDGFASIIEYTMNQRNAKKDEFEEMIKTAKNLVSKRDVTDTSATKDKVKALEQQWKNLGDILTEKQRLGKARSEQLAAYEALRFKVLEWLSKMELTVEKLESVALDKDVLKKQATETKPLVKEHSDYSSTVDKINDFGNTYDNMIRGESPRRKVSSPTKKPTSPSRKSPSKARSPDSFPTSPVKGQISTQSPLSTISSGFSSRRSSSDNLGGIDDLSPIQQQLSEINHRYSLLGVKLSDRSNEINHLIEEIKSYLEIIKVITAFVDAKEKQVPKEALPSSKDQADKHLKTLKSIQDEMLEKQPDVDHLKTQTKDLLKRKLSAKGASELQYEVTEVEVKWTELASSIKQRLIFLQDLKDFQDTYVLLSNWLVQREKMFQVLGPIASEPRMVSSQVQQVQVMRDEFTSQKTLLDRLNQSGNAVLQSSNASNSSTKKVTEQMESIHHLWEDLVGKLGEREKNLEAASGVAKDFHRSLSELQEKLQKVSDSFDHLLENGAGPEDQLKKLNDLEDHLEKQRPLLTDADSVCEQLCEILSDSASKNEIKNKVNTLEKLYNNLNKKINNRKAELESSLKEDRGFFKSCDDIQSWLNKTDEKFLRELRISADVDKLTKQAQDYEPLYKLVMDKEHELHLLLSKGTDMVTKITHKQEANALKNKLSNVQKQWEKIRKTAIERHTHLQSCLDNCKKYHVATEIFLPWLETSEEKLKSFKPVSFHRATLGKQVKEIQSFKNDLSKHIQEYENIRHLGESLVSTCDTDKDAIKNQLDQLKKRWEKLNQGISSRVQSFEDLSQKLLEYQEKMRDLQHAFQRLEDKLASHDALGEVARDPKLLDRLKTLLKEAIGMKKQLSSVREFSRSLISKAGEGTDCSEILDDVEAIEKKHQILLKNLEERCSNLAAASEVLTQFTTQVKTIHSDLNNLDEVFDKMSPVARDKKTLDTQIIEIKDFTSHLVKARDDSDNAEHQCQNIIANGYAPDPKGCKEQLQNLQRQLVRLEEHAKIRETSLETTLARLEHFYEDYNDTRIDLKAVIKEEESFKPIGGDVETIRSQQNAFKKFITERIEPLNKQIDESNKMGQGLIQSASPGVNTSGLEKDLENLNDAWNSLQERLNDREKKLDVALLQSGKFQEALSGVQKWLKDIEGMVDNQKPPSSDFKVVKAQVQEQKFVKKMLLDRQNSVMSIKVMGTELMQSTKTTEQEQVDGQMTTIIERFDELTSEAQSRMNALEKTIPVAEEFQNTITPLFEWLEQTEKKLTSMATVPVEEDRIKARIIEHKKIHEDITTHKKSVDKLKDVGDKLMKLVGKDEAESLAEKVQEVTTKYTEITETSKIIAQTLKNAEKGLSVFTVTYERTVSWVEKTTVYLTNFQIFSVYSDKLQEQVKDLKKLKADISKEQATVEGVMVSGQDIMKHASGEDAIQMKEKLDTLNVKFAELSNRVTERLKQAEDSLPLVQAFYNANSKLSTWLDGAERSIKTLETTALNVQEVTIQKLETEIQEYRAVLETINHTGPQLCQLSPGDGAAIIESLISRANHRFDVICEQVQRKAERIELAKQRNFEVVGDVDELLDWFKEIEKQVTEAEGLSPELDLLTVLLKEQKSLNEEVSSQKGRVRDIMASAKKLMRESSSEDLSFIREKVETLKTLTNNVSVVCSERLSALEQAVPLAEHFFETHIDLVQWLDEVEGEAELLEAPALNAIQIKKQQDRNKGLVQSINEHKPLVDKLNKTGSALTKLCKEEEIDKVDIILESDNSRYNALRKILREHQNALEEALQATSQFSDKLEGMLNALTSTADQLHNAEPISAHPDRIQEQINDNKAVLQDLDKRTTALEAVKKAADDVIVKAGSIDEPAVRDIRKKLDRLNDLWDTIQTAARNRGKSLEEALIAAEKFWDELTAVMKALKELQDNLNTQEAPAVEPSAVQQQQEVLQEIKQEMNQTKPEVDQCRQAGQDLMQLCGEPDKPEVKKHIEDLDSVWENVTTLYAKREQNLIDAMEKAMNFHDTLQNLLEFLDTAEDKFSNLAAVSSDIDAVKTQINQLKDFKVEVDPHMIEVESLNRQAQELMERTSPDQGLSIREPLADINRRWEDLLKGIVERQQEMENALLRLGQFQHALEELMVWMSKTEKTLDELKPVFGDPQVIEVVLAKHKVVTNDIQAHQTSVDTINRAGRQLVDSDQGSEDAKFTQNKLNNLNSRWQQLQDKSAERQRELEEALKEAQQFHQEIQDLLMWISDTDGQLVSSKLVGGLPETAREQLNRFMELYNDLDGNRHKVENVLQQGQSYLKKSGDNSTKALQHSLRTLKQRWDSILNKANDRKIKLEIALREATEFHEALQKFVEWLTNAEKYLTNLKPVSRAMKTVLEQIEDHRNFQKVVGAHRELMLNLDKKGTHLKYFSQKQDVILIKNLLISVQHRWERVVSKAAERTRALDHGYKEAKEFHDAWTSLSTWLDEAEKSLDSVTHIGNDPQRIKQLLSKHKEFQRVLGSKQAVFDSTMKTGRTLKDKCPKLDVPALQGMMDELKNRWNRVCSKSVDRQRKLEEALLYSGQFKEAVQALIDWLDKALATLSETKPLNGDLDTVMSLVDQHKTFQDELKNRGISLESVRKTAKDLQQSASPEDADHIHKQVEQLDSKWKQVAELSEIHQQKLDESLKQAEKLHKAVHMLLEWLSDAEMKLRFAGPLPEDEEIIRQQIADHQAFLQEMEKQEINKNDTIEHAQEILKKCHPDGISVIRHWITIIQSRWEEISIWARQRNQRLQDHLRSLRDIMDLLDELLAWLNTAEASLTALEAEPLPDDLPTLEQLIKDHQVFMDDMSKKQPDVERVTKAFSTKRQPTKPLPQTPTKDRAARDRPTRGAMPGTPRTSTPVRQHAEPDIKNPRARHLVEKWRNVWLLAMERQRRLRDKYNYLLELERIKNFDFNEWRKRYLGWMNNKKSRIMDQFRKIDKNNDGKVTKQEFIDGILKSKFPTSRLEMERVADVFDRNGDGFIDTKEYIDTLRPDREGHPKTDAEKIQDEVQRQVAKCTCVHRFKVYQVGEGKYRFGDSQKLRLVRILRSTVMVRVGGGWVALDEFLVKNDPCRAKGRTNLELREQFILAEGVSQSMAPFKPKPSPNSSVSSQSGASSSFPRSGSSIRSTGPITKVREKSERSAPMRKSRSSADTSSDISGPSFSETDSFSTRSGLSRATPTSTRATPTSTRLSPRSAGSKPSSRPSSRQGSRPSSRAASDLSQEGVEDYKKCRKATTGSASGRQRIPSSSSQTSSPGSKAKTSTTGINRSKIPSVKTTPPTTSGRSGSQENLKKREKLK